MNYKTYFICILFSLSVNIMQASMQSTPSITTTNQSNNIQATAYVDDSGQLTINLSNEPATLSISDLCKIAKTIGTEDKKNNIYRSASLVTEAIVRDTHSKRNPKDLTEKTLKLLDTLYIKGSSELVPFKNY